MAVELQELDLISIFTTPQPITGMELKGHHLSDTSFYTYSAFRAYEPQLGYLATILVSRYQRTYNVVSNLTILGYTLLTKLTPLCHPMRSIKPKPIVICSRTFNRASPQHVYFPTRVSYDTQLKNALSLGKMQCQCRQSYNLHEGRAYVVTSLLWSYVNDSYKSSAKYLT